MFAFNKFFTLLVSFSFSDKHYSLIIDFLCAQKKTLKFELYDKSLLRSGYRPDRQKSRVSVYR